MVAWRERHIGFFHQSFRRGFQTHGAYGFDWWADEYDVIGAASFSKAFVFRQKAIAWMHGLCTCLLTAGDDFIGL